jgi:hypothetical protein
MKRRRCHPGGHHGHHAVTLRLPFAVHVNVLPKKHHHPRKKK